MNNVIKQIELTELELGKYKQLLEFASKLERDNPFFNKDTTIVLIRKLLSQEKILNQLANLQHDLLMSNMFLEDDNSGLYDLILENTDYSNKN